MLFKQTWYWTLFAYITVVCVGLGMSGSAGLSIGMGWWMLAPYPVAVTILVGHAVKNAPREWGHAGMFAQLPVALYVAVFISPFIGLLMAPMYFALTGDALVALALGVLSFATSFHLTGKSIFPII